jgi:hypothetical protein
MASGHALRERLLADALVLSTLEGGASRELTFARGAR